MNKWLIKRSKKNYESLFEEIRSFIENNYGNNNFEVLLGRLIMLYVNYDKVLDCGWHISKDWDPTGLTF